MSNNPQLNNTDWRNATGPIDYTMTNDVMFRMVLQSNENVLRGLISSMMHIPINDIVSTTIMNPVKPADYVSGKSFTLDVKVLLNNKSIINLEMQVSNKGDWINRSLSYLCRTFDNVLKGSSYNSAIAVTHIGFLDFNLFPDENEFYSRFMLQNVNTHRIYNDKFCLNVLSLNKIDDATEEDKKWHIDEWARLFKATTWEEIKMLASKDKVYSEMANSMYLQNTDDVTRQICEARREAEQYEEYILQQIKEKDALLQEKDAKLQELTTLIEELQAKLASLENS